jgi:hypothetical protein
MARKEMVTSDLTGKPVVDAVKIRVSRDGHHIQIGKNTYCGDTVLEIDASELSDVMNKLKFVKTVSTPAFMRSDTPDFATATFFGPVGQLPKEPEKVSVVRPGVATESLSAGEHP